MSTALIGHTGFVGSVLRRQTNFDALFRSTNILEIRGATYETVVCAGAPAQKWLANLHPQDDKTSIDSLIANLSAVSCKRFILISTVDVFRSPIGVDETTATEETGLHPYGLHRLQLEQFVRRHFENHLVVRLPGLVGPGLKKNIIFDFFHHNETNKIDCRGVFQFYPMVNLWFDLQVALRADLRLVHLTAEPISVGEVSEAGFGVPFTNQLERPPAVYDMRTRHAAIFGGNGHYQYSKRDTIQAVRSYAQSEPAHNAKATGGQS